MPSKPKLHACRNTVSSVLVGVLVVHDAGGRAGQQPHQLRLALGQRQRPKILSVEFQQVERMKDRVGRRAPVVERSENGDAKGPATAASPSSVNDLARSLAATAAIPGYRSVQS
jgi:hypothetical protein